MEHLSDVARYLDLVARRLEEEKTPRPFGHAPFVTISRQAGADGHALADAVLRALARRQGEAFEGWEVLDRALLHLMTEEPRLRVSMRYLLDEEYHSRMTDYFEQALAWWSPQDVVQARIFRSVRALAGGAGKIIIVGRAGACVTSELRGGVHVRLAASEERRVAAFRRRTGLDEKRARRRLIEMEEARAMLVRAHFRRDIDDPLLYDAVFNEDRLPSGEIAEWIVGEIEKKTALIASRTASPQTQRP